MTKRKQNAGYKRKAKTEKPSSEKPNPFTTLHAKLKIDGNLQKLNEFVTQYGKEEGSKRFLEYTKAEELRKCQEQYGIENGTRLFNQLSETLDQYNKDHPMEFCKKCGKLLSEKDIELSPTLGPNNYFCEPCGVEWVTTMVEATKSFMEGDLDRTFRIVKEGTNIDENNITDALNQMQALKKVIEKDEGTGDQKEE